MAYGDVTRISHFGPKPKTPQTSDYKEALHAAMLYAQSVVQDSMLGLGAPSQRSDMLLKELTTTHKDTILSINLPTLAP